MAEKKYLDLTGLSHYDEKIKKIIEDGDKASKDYVDGKIGSLGQGVATVAAAIAAEKNSREQADTTINTSIEKLNATHATKEDGSYKTVAEEADAAVAKVIGDAPEAFDTLKEIADWIQGEGSESFDAAKRITDLETEVGSDTTAGSIKGRIKALEDGGNFSAITNTEIDGLFT